MGTENNIRSGYCLYGLAVLINLMILIFVYPGFMSYDSLHALREARFGVTGGSYPPYVSYIWRPLDKLWPGPALMMLIQNGLLLLSMAHILRLLGLGSSWKGHAILIFLASFPPLLGSMIVVWKDVAVAACFLAVVAISMQMYVVNGMLQKRILLVCGLAFLFSGMAYRFNAASGALPLIFCLFWVARANTADKLSARQCIAYISFVSVAFMGLFSMVYLLNSYRLPGFEHFKPNYGFTAIASFDLIGISKFERRIVFAESKDESGPLPSAEVLDRIYEPRHLNDTMKNYSQIDPAGHSAFGRLKIGDIWLKSVRSFPLSYFRHRAEVTRQLIGFTNGPQFYPTHFSVDENELGVAHIPNEISRGIYYYVHYGVDELILRPWIIYLSMILLAPLFWYFSANKIFTVTLCASSLLYFLPMIFILPAADLRYNFWSMMSAIVCMVIGFSSLPLVLPRFHMVVFGRKLEKNRTVSG